MSSSESAQDLRDRVSEYFEKVEERIQDQVVRLRDVKTPSASASEGSAQAAIDETQDFLDTYLS